MSFFAELLAMKEAVALVASLNLNKIDVFTDSIKAWKVTKKNEISF